MYKNCAIYTSKIFKLALAVLSSCVSTKLFANCCDKVKELFNKYLILTNFRFIFKIFKLKSAEFW